VCVDTDEDRLPWRRGENPGSNRGLVKHLAVWANIRHDVSPIRTYPGFGNRGHKARTFRLPGASKKVTQSE